MAINTEAWSILNRDEKLSITLSLGHNKSSWESGEIMNKSHYKYLEINARAERFLRMFTEYFQLYGELFPAGHKMPDHFVKYLTYLVIQRKSMKETIALMENKDYQFSGAREVTLEKCMLALRSSHNKGEKELFDLLLEFDRWNNFRILPKKLQQPSAFKRRNKTRELKHLRSITDLPLYSVKKIEEKFQFTQKGKACFFVLVGQNIKGNYKIIRIPDRAKEKTQISQLGFFLFPEELQAISWARLVINYLYPEVVIGFSPVIKGLQFWTPYRALLTKSLNYLQVYNLVPNRKYVEDALIDLQLKRKKIKVVK